MMCERLDRGQLTQLPAGFRARLLRREELALWEAMPFDAAQQARTHREEMQAFYRAVYLPREPAFWARCTVLTDRADQPIATALLWDAYDPPFTTLHWLKVKKEYEGQGLGRALLSHLLRDVPKEGFPVFLHTQPESFRAIKLYADLGFVLLTNDLIGHRRNDLAQGLEALRQRMPAHAFDALRFGQAPRAFLQAAERSPIHQF